MVDQLLKKLRDEGINIFRLVLMQKDGSYEIAEAFPTAPCHNCYSVSKAVTATAIGILQDKGKLSVKDSMDNFFDLKEYDSEAWKKINIEHLLLKEHLRCYTSSPELTLSCSLIPMNGLILYFG